MAALTFKLCLFAIQLRIHINWLETQPTTWISRTLLAKNRPSFLPSSFSLIFFFFSPLLLPSSVLFPSPPIPYCRLPYSRGLHCSPPILPTFSPPIPGFPEPALPRTLPVPSPPPLPLLLSFSPLILSSSLPLPSPLLLSNILLSSSIIFSSCYSFKQ